MSTFVDHYFLPIIVFFFQVHEQDEVLSVWAPDVHEYSPYKALAEFGVFIGVLSAFSYLVYKTYPDKTAVSIQYHISNAILVCTIRDCSILDFCMPKISNWP